MYTARTYTEPSERPYRDFTVPYRTRTFQKKARYGRTRTVPYLFTS